MSRSSLSLVLAVALLLLGGCDMPYGPASFKRHGCEKCHNTVLDEAHDIGCIRCHQGNPDGRFLKDAHEGLVAHPASPNNMKRFCGRCHEKEVGHAVGDDHFTLKDEIGLVWQAFLPGSEVPGPAELRREEYPWSLQGLVADLLRKRCLSCHVYYQGDDYGGTRRGTGCAACHLDTASGGNPLDHRFIQSPGDDRCLACHYGNFTGWDFYGRFEKDYPAEFRAPLHRGHHIPRPYGVEWLDMTADIHKRAGMSCVECHQRGPCQDQEPVSCLKCHETSVLSEMTPAHSSKALERISCTVCHAVWAPLDAGRSVMRLDLPDYDEWLRLSVQGSSEVEALCMEQSQLPFEQWEPARMLDKIDGKVMPGMWFQGFVGRRFWPVVIGETGDGRLVNVRPLLDISISYLNADDMIMADGLRPRGSVQEGCGTDCVKIIRREFLPGTSWLEYVEPELLESPGLWLEFLPHTVGPADFFRTQKALAWLESKVK